MKAKNFEIEAKTPFSKSIIWQLNRDFYQEQGISAWSDDIVPHHMTSNSKVGKTYAELIYAFLKDLALKGSNQDVVYILELGAGHGRLAFHILTHLEVLVHSTNVEVPKYCYVLSDIVEDNLLFFHKHPQLQNYFSEGLLDLTYFDATESTELYLRNSKKSINPKDLKQPILAIANYFFDSIPNDLYFVKDEVVSSCSVSISSSMDPKGMETESLIKNMEMTYHNEVLSSPLCKEALLNEILEEYRYSLSSTYIFFPENAITCLQHLQSLSSEGLVLLSMDKGYHELHNLKDKKEPDIITHGSLSLWVNYHALSAYCTKQGGKSLFPAFSNFHLEIACLLFLKESETYLHTNAAYQQFVNDFGPDDFNSIKQLSYFNLSRLRFIEIIALIRLSAYDSTFFIKLLPRLKELSTSITFNERERLSQTLHRVWEMYFNINETFDLAYEIGGIFYDLGFYSKALNYFQYSIALFGQNADIFYNQALCYYQLRQDKLFFKTLTEAKKVFPDFELFKDLDKLDMK